MAMLKDLVPFFSSLSTEDQLALISDIRFQRHTYTETKKTTIKKREKKTTLVSSGSDLMALVDNLSPDEIRKLLGVFDNVERNT
ncbi:MAG: hypothetical protein BWY21_00405 [Parcubacteria group bacterium ADurb.Bin216]|jgi:hypothetical protein|nr:MAG: hypothetical protein BWY21_00405 [Parcubacteria group bacterium ADurb.Bin216]